MRDLYHHCKMIKAIFLKKKIYIYSLEVARVSGKWKMIKAALDMRYWDSLEWCRDYRDGETNMCIDLALMFMLINPMSTVIFWFNFSETLDIVYHSFILQILSPINCLNGAFSWLPSYLIRWAFLIFLMFLLFCL